jgi:hypothetical protein
MSTEIPNPRRELARRLNGGLEVTLYWNADDNSTSVEVWQTTTDEKLSFAVARDRALDAFYHPFAHLAACPAVLIPAS